MRKVSFLVIITVILISCKPVNNLVHVTKVKLDFEELILTKGESKMLKAEVLPSNASNNRVIWQSSDEKIAVVNSNGEVKAISAGLSIITVITEDGNKKATCKVLVKSNSEGADCNIGGVAFEFVEIPKGSFMMGAPDTEKKSDYDEKPLHKVNLNGFYMCKYEITQAQWKAVMGADNNPSHFKGDSLPVEKVSWENVEQFIKKLNQLTGKQYRLPTEAEWEYACRAGTTTPFFTGGNITTDQANYNGNYPYNGNPKGEYREKTVKVDTFAPNAWGLYNMCGNVSEWCNDLYQENYYKNSPEDNPSGPKENDDNYRVCRGGAWCLFGKVCRSADRAKAKGGFHFIGFRLVLSK